jgi:hypothetical protein
MSEILARLDVDTREEAVDLWKRYNGLPYRLHRLARYLADGYVALGSSGRWRGGGRDGRRRRRVRRCNRPIRWRAFRQSGRLFTRHE